MENAIQGLNKALTDIGIQRALLAQIDPIVAGFNAILEGKDKEIAELKVQLAEATNPIIEVPNEPKSPVKK